MDIKSILNSGDVLRFHALPRIEKQTLSQHQWGVAIICKYLKDNIKADELMLALTHDATELITGDIPATFKWSFPEIKNILNDVENQITFIPTYDCDKDFKYVLKIADMIEGMIYCYNQYYVGNNEGKRVYFIWKNALTKYIQNNNEISPRIIYRVHILLKEYEVND
jgi:5'-deoxynucleotidase YfbR-like HD superfamily hydrolase